MPPHMKHTVLVNMTRVWNFLSGHCPDVAYFCWKCH